MGKYFTEVERYQLEVMLTDKIPVIEIAKRLDKTRQTIYNEIKRGTVIQIDTELREHKVYKADYAHRISTENQSAKGRSLKIGSDFALVDFIETKINHDKWSPDAIIGYIQKEKLQFQTSICSKTLYNYIHSGLFLNISSKCIKKYKKKKKEKHSPVALHNISSRSIAERPPEIFERDTFGHWEMDTVVSGHGYKSCLLVLSERQSRYELIRKIESKTQKAVIDALDQIEQTLGNSFYSIFKTITMDNGVEFLDSDSLEHSSIFAGKRTEVYYCHPYSSWERGTNENINKMIRKWIPKGVDIGKYTDAQIEKIEKWINNYPRKIFDYYSSQEMLALNF